MAATMVDAPKRTVLESSAPASYATAVAPAPSQPATSYPMGTPAVSPAPVAGGKGGLNRTYMMAGVIVVVAAVLLGVVMFARRPSPAPLPAMLEAGMRL